MLVERIDGEVIQKITENEKEIIIYNIASAENILWLRNHMTAKLDRITINQDKIPVDRAIASKMETILSKRWNSCGAKSTTNTQASAGVTALSMMPSSRASLIFSKTRIKGLKNCPRKNKRKI